MRALCLRTQHMYFVKIALCENPGRYQSKSIARMIERHPDGGIAKVTVVSVTVTLYKLSIFQWTDVVID